MSSEANEALAASLAPTATAPSSSGDAPPTSQPPLQRTDTDASVHSCFICLQTSSETPSTTWVNACPCTLEAHEDCMLTWIAEHERESTKSLRCPACKGNIKTHEPQDRFVGLSDKLHEMYTRVTPAILIGILTGCSMAGSSYYGLVSLSVFAGPRPALSWLGLGKALADRRSLRAVPWYRWKAGWHFCFRFWLLHFIAPALLIQKALPPQLIDFVTVPVSVFYGAVLVLRNDMPAWPPSAAWVATALPWVSFSYNRIYFDLFGSYERRLNKALRGRGMAEEPPAQGNNGGAQQANLAAEHDAAPDDEDVGYIAQALRVGNAVLNMMGDDDPDRELVARIDVEIGVNADDEEVIEDLRHDIEELNELIAPIEDEPAQEPAQAREEQVAAEAEQDEGAAAPPPNIPAEPRADNQQAPEEPIREARGTSTFAQLLNGMVSALTFPLVCWASGEVLRHTLPSPWVTRPPRVVTGILQEQWGRSMVGGAMYVVARDMLNLYTKHRRVEVRNRRKVRNVPRRNPKGGLAKQDGEAATS